MTQPPTRSARHAAPATRRSLGSFTLSTAAMKSATGIGLVVGATALVATPSATSASTRTPTSDASASSAAQTLLAGRTDDASRSTSRAALRAPTDIPAPVVNGGMTTGDLGVDVVRKPKPKPKPAPVEPTEDPAATTGTDQADQPAGTTPDTTAETQTDTSTTDTSTEAQTPTPTQTPAPDTAAVDTSSFASQAQAIGLGPNATRVYSAVRTQFPSMTNIGGYRAGDPGDHGSGRAVDIMCGSAEGDAVAQYLIAHMGELNITYIIWKQRIWMGSGWRAMEDRGSPTANHFDHVHVSVS